MTDTQAALEADLDFLSELVSEDIPDGTREKAESALERIRDALQSRTEQEPVACPVAAQQLLTELRRIKRTRQGEWTRMRFIPDTVFMAQPEVERILGDIHIELDAVADKLEQLLCPKP